MLVLDHRYTPPVCAMLLVTNSFFFEMFYIVTGQAGCSGSSCLECDSYNNHIVFVTQQCLIVFCYHMNLAHSKHYNTTYMPTFMAFGKLIFYMMT